jgi:hypothetical protein
VAELSRFQPLIGVTPIGSFVVKTVTRLQGGYAPMH